MPSDVLITPASSKIEFTDGANATKTLKITGTSLNTDTSFAIGATTANNTLSVLGSASIGSSYNVAGPTNGLIVQGNVGIGITSPSNTKLHIVGDWVSGHSTVKVQGITDNTTGYGFYDTAGSRLGYLAYTGAAFEWYNNANVPVIFYSNTLERMRIAADGKVGIGTTSPASKLHIYDSTYSFTRCTNTANAGHYVDIGANSAGQSFLFSYGAYPVLIGTNGGERVRIDTSGNVGIGTTSPSSKLHIDDVNAPWITISRSGTPTWQLRNNYPNNQYGFSFNNTTAGTVPLFIGAGGNIGLGIDNPSVRLDIANTQANGIVMRYDTTTAYQAWIRPYWNSGTDTRVDFAINRTANVAPDVIMSVGYGTNVGIGTTTPSYKLHVSQAIPTGTTSAPANTSIQVDSNTNNYLSFVNTADNGTYAGLTFVDNNVGGYIVFRNYTGDVSTGSDSLIYGTYQDHIFQTGTTSGINSRNEVLRIKNNGNVGIGVNSPNNKLHVNGSMSIGSGYNTAGPTNGLIVQGNVGIGVTNPSTYSSQLAIETSQTRAIMAFNTALADAGTLYGLGFGYAMSNYNSAYISFYKVGNSSTSNRLSFSLWNQNDILNINGAGNVGIGITVPLAQLHINEATSGAAALRVDGTNGTLFSVVDDLSDSLMSVNNSAGLPVLEVFADDRVVMGQYGANDFVLRNNKIGVGTNNPNDQLTFAQVDDDAIQIRRRTVSQGGPAAGTGISWTWTSATTDTETWAAIRAIFPGNSDSHLTFSTRNTSSVFGERMRIQNSGNVGINNTNPVFRLDVNGTSGFRDTIAIGPSIGTITWGSMGGGTGFGIRAESGRAFSLGANGNYDHIVINTSGNVGVGTTGPIARLHVYDTNQSPATGNLLVTSTGGNASIRIDSSSISQYTYFTLSQGGTGRFELGIVPTSSDFYINPTVQSGANGAAIYVKKADGNVGINSTSPNSPLTVYNNSDVWHFRLGGASGELRMGGQTNSGAVIQAYTPGGAFRDLYLQRDGGNVGITTNSPNAKLHIIGATNTDAGLRGGTVHVRDSTASSSPATAGMAGIAFSSAPGTDWAIGKYYSGTTSRFVIKDAGSALGTNLLAIDANGNVGIGIDSPTAKLHLVATGGDGTPALRIVGSASDTFNWASSTMYANLVAAETAIHLIGKAQSQYNSAYLGYRHVADGSSSNMLSLGLYSADHLVNILGNGNVGIGTTSSNAKVESYFSSNALTFNYLATNLNNNSPVSTYAFDVTNGAGETRAIKGGIGFERWNPNGGGSLHFYNNNSNDSSNISGTRNSPGNIRMSIDYGGNIGINTTTPSRRLQVNGDVAFATNSGGLIIASYDGDTPNLRPSVANGSILISDDSGSVNRGTEFLNGGGIVIQSLSGFTPLDVRSNSASLLFVTSAGNVGIGTTVPTAYAGYTSLTIGNPNSIGLIKLRSAYSSGNGAEIYQTGSGHLLLNINSSLTSMYLKVDGNVGVGTVNPLSKLAVDGVTSVGPSSKLSLIGLDINSGATPTYIKIVTTIPFASGAADFTVNIKGFAYGSTNAVDLSICWHYYLSTFYNATAKSSGGWAPTIRLSAEGGFVAIVLTAGIYWPKLYVESMYSSSYSNQYSTGWSWVDADATGSPIVTVPYISHFGNNFIKYGDGTVTIKGSDNNSGKADLSVDSGGTATMALLGQYFRVGSTDVNWGMKVQADGYIATWAQSMRFSTDSGANPITFSTDSVEKMRIAGDGNVGVGTTSPSRKLHVYSSNLSDNTVNPLLLIDGKFTTAGVDSNDIVGIAFRVENSAGGSQTSTCIGSSYQGAGNSLLLQPVSGNVGVGTINPSFKFEIGAGTSDVVVAKLTQGYERVRYYGFDLLGYNDGNLWMIGNNAANALILGGSWDWDRQIAIVYTPATTGAAGGSLEIGQLTKNNANFTHGNTRFYTNGVERLRIISNGYVGIGASSPTYKLQIGTVGSLADSIRIGTYLVAKNTRQYIGYTRDDSGLFESAGDGDTPATVKGGVAGIRIVNTTGTLASAYADNSVQLLTHIFNGGSRVVLHANYDGNVGIGTSVPAALLQIGSGTPTSATGGLQFGDDTGTRLYRSSSGVITCSGTIAATFSGNLTGNVTGNASGSSTFVASLGSGLNYDNDRTTKRAGLSHYSGYSTGTNRPTTYDYTLQVTDGNKGWEISMDWIATTGPAIYARSLRDCCQNWSSWVRILDSANYSFAANMNQNVRTTDGVTFANITGNGQLNINHSTPTAVARLWSGGSTIWSLGVGDASGSYFNISADFGSFTINKSNGYVGIGTTSQTTRLQLGSGTPTASADGIQFGGDTSARIYRSSSAVVSVSNSFAAANGYVYASNYLQTGNNLIYPAGFSSTQRLAVGNAAQNNWIDGLTLAPGGNVVIAGTLTESSSIRYKENIETISAPILPKLNKIRPVTYNKKDNPKHIEYGIIAEELNELFPEFVNKNDKGEVESVNYSRLTVILIKAVKELQEEVEKLKNK